MSVTLREASNEESENLIPIQQGRWDMTVNTLGVMFNPDFISAFRSVLETDAYLPTWSCWIRGRHISLAKESAVIREMLKHHRNDPDGFFNYTKETYTKLINEIFPEYELVNNDIILFCQKEHSDKYRKLILNNLKELPAEQILELAEEEVGSWDKSVSLNRLNSFTSTVLSHFLLGKSTPFKAIDVFNDGLVRRSLGLPGSEAYKNALKTIHDEIEETLATSSTPFIEELKESELTPLQQRVMIFILFFAGQETTASALTYIIWDLALHPEKQEEIFEQLEKDDINTAAKRAGNYTTIQKIIAMGLFNHPPAPSFARMANKDLVMQFGEEKRLIPKGRQINACPIFARNKEPNLTPTNYPFSYGPNSCPGQHLAQMEMRLFLVALIKRFRFSTTQTKVKQVCRLTLKLEPEIFIQLEKRT